MGCGTGLHALELFKRGYEVTALDKSAKMVEIARKRLSKTGVRVDHADISKWKADGKYDAVISLFVTLSYILEPEKVIAAFNNIYGSLKERGLFFFSIYNKLWAYKNLTPVDAYEFPDGKIAWEQKLLEGADEVVWKARIHYNDGRKAKDLQYYRIYSGPELELILRATGFSKIEYYCGQFSSRIDLQKYSADASHLHVLAVK